MLMGMLPIVAQTSGPAALLNSSLAAHRALKSFRAHVTLATSGRGAAQSLTTYDLAVDGASVLLRVRRPRQAGMERSDRALFFGPTRLVAYDAVANEKLSRPLPPNASRVDRIVFILGPLDDMLRNLLQPSGMEEFYSSLKRLSGWKQSAVRSRTYLSRQVRVQGGTNKILLGFDIGKPLLRQFDLSTPEGEVHWKFDYASAGRVAFQPPVGATTVSAFTLAPEPPKYASSRAQSVVASMLKAYKEFRRGVITVRGDDGNVRIALEGSRVKEDQRWLSYAFDGATLTAVDRRRRLFYRGRASRITIPELIADMGGRCDPLARQFLQGKTPYQEILRPTMTVSLAGQVRVANTDCDIVRMAEPRSQVSMFVRRDNHLVSSVTTDILDGQGHSIASSERSFQYGAPLRETYAIARPAGWKILPLPKLKNLLGR